MVLVYSVPSTQQMPSGQMRSYGMVACAVAGCFRSSPLARFNAAAISRLSARVSLTDVVILLDNSLHLLVERRLPMQRGVKVVGLIGPLLRAAEAYLNDVSQDFLEGLAVSFIHGEQEVRKHGHNHDERSGADVEIGFEQKENRHTDECAEAEEDQLSFGEVKDHFCLDLR